MKKNMVMMVLFVLALAGIAQAEIRNVKVKDGVVGNIPVISAKGVITDSGVSTAVVTGSVAKVNILWTNGVRKAISTVTVTNGSAVTAFDADNTSTNEMADLIAILLQRTQ